MPAPVITTKGAEFLHHWESNSTWKNSIVHRKEASFHILFWNITCTIINSPTTTKSTLWKFANTYVLWFENYFTYYTYVKGFDSWGDSTNYPFGLEVRMEKQQQLFTVSEYLPSTFHTSQLKGLLSVLWTKFKGSRIDRCGKKRTRPWTSRRRTNRRYDIGFPEIVPTEYQTKCDAY